jgi:GntR family transcriptional regulator
MLPYYYLFVKCGFFKSFGTSSSLYISGILAIIVTLMSGTFKNISLDKNIPIPLYYQLKKQILLLIESREIKEGELLPPENDLCKILNISRPTVRQALAELVNEGYLHRYKGKGTFVSTPKINDRFFSKLETYHDEMVEKGYHPKTLVIKLEKINGPHEANERLSLPINAQLIHLSRVRSVDTVPMVYVKTYLPYEEFKDLMQVDFTVNSLYDSLEKMFDKRVNRVWREFFAVNANKKEAELLQTTRNKTLEKSGGKKRTECTYR